MNCAQTDCRYCLKDYTGDLLCTTQPDLRVNSLDTLPNLLRCMTFKVRVNPAWVDLRDSTGLYPGQVRPPEEDVEDEKTECDT